MQTLLLSAARGVCPNPLQQKADIQLQINNEGAAQISQYT